MTITKRSDLPMRSRLRLALGLRPKTRAEAVASIRDHAEALGFGDRLGTDEEVERGIATAARTLGRAGISTEDGLRALRVFREAYAEHSGREPDDDREGGGR